MLKFDEFDYIWGKKIKEKRESLGLSIESVSCKLNLNHNITKDAEKTPSQVPLCYLNLLFKCYRFTIEEMSHYVEDINFFSQKI